MKIFNVFCVAVIAILLAVPALANCNIHPNPGKYLTSNGTILPGRASEAWCAGMGPGYPGNTENAMSWDGSVLGAQWHVYGMTINSLGARETARDVDEYGNGWIDYVTDYDGGVFWLSKNHTWGDGVNDLTGQLTFYNVTARVTLVLGQIKAVTSNVMFRGFFDECPDCLLQYVITNAMLVWQTGWESQPDNYPPFLCGVDYGEYYNVCCIIANIYCPVSAEPATWGAIKSLF